MLKDTAAEKQFTYMRRRSHELSNMSYNHHEKSLDKELSLSLPEVRIYMLSLFLFK